jgi:hypothetical protein
VRRSPAGLLLALALVARAQDTPAPAPPESALETGLRAYREGRTAEAATRLEAALAASPDYEGWLTLGLAYGRLQQFAPARRAFDAAVALAPRRPEAWVERGGLAFLEHDYPRAVADLQRALARAPEDGYARDLLASSLHLAGRADEALALWNRAGQPLLAQVRLTGLVHTRERVVRRELAFGEGRLLELGALRRGRLRLIELGIFDRVTLRPLPRGDGQADLELALGERHGFFATRADFLASTAIGALQGRARLRYRNLGGAGVSLGGEVRWQPNRPRLELSGEWPRPFGLPVTLRVQGFRGRQRYDVGEEVLERSRGLDLVLRHVAGPATVVQLDLRTRERRFSRPRPDAPSGAVVGPELGIEQRLVDAYRLKVDAGLRAFGTLPGLGSDLRYFRAVATLEGRVFLAPPEGASLERSVLALRLRGGHGGRGTPLDDLFAPGGSPDMELPVRGHRQLRGGTLGATPLGRSLMLMNVEWRRRVWSGTALQAGVVVFYDSARIAGRPEGPPATLHDVGVGLRVALRGASTLRVDFGHGLRDGRNALFVGLGQVF